MFLIALVLVPFVLAGTAYVFDAWRFAGGNDRLAREEV